MAHTNFSTKLFSRAAQALFCNKGTALAVPHKRCFVTRAWLQPGRQCNEMSVGLQPLREAGMALYGLFHQAV